LLDESENKVAYTWAETPEEVTLWVNFDKQTSKHDLVVKIESQTLKIVHKNQTYLDGELAHAISVDTSTWTLSDGKLEIILSKNNQSLNWSHLVLNDLRGRKVLDAETAAEYETVLNTTKDTVIDAILLIIFYNQVSILFENKLPVFKFLISNQEMVDDLQSSAVNN
jgi:hypothetical protein